METLHYFLIGPTQSSRASRGFLQQYPDVTKSRRQEAKMGLKYGVCHALALSISLPK